MPVVLCCISLSAWAQSNPREQQAEGIGSAPPVLKVSDGLFVTVPPHDQVLGAFAVVNNEGAPHLMTGFASPACAVLRMEQWDGSPPNAGPLELTVPGKSKMVFLRGGYHLHCERPTRAFKVGDTVEVTVSFEGLAPVKAMFQVRDYTAPGVAAQ